MEKDSNGLFTKSTGYLTNGWMSRHGRKLLNVFRLKTKGSSVYDTVTTLVKDTRPWLIHRYVRLKHIHAFAVKTLLTYYHLAETQYRQKYIQNLSSKINTSGSIWKWHIKKKLYLIIIIIMMFIDCKWVDTRWQWSFNMLHMHGLWRLII